METIKSYTDIPQSIKLDEILPLKSADLYYSYYGNPKYNPTFAYEGEQWFLSKDLNAIHDIPCWSLETLLKIIPKHINDYNVLRIDISDNNFAIWYDEIGYGVNNELPNITKESAVDACVQMIIELNKMNLI